MSMPFDLLEPESMNTEWKPIASAPQTGRTLLLGYWNSHGKWRTVRGRWMSLEYIAEHWEDPDDAEAGWFETAVEADDAPNCWPVSPSHWQPMPAPPCPTCNDQGAVGNILTAEPCPDCSSAPTSHPIPTGATGEDEQSAFERWFERTCPSGDVESVQRQWEASSDYADFHDPAAGDALDAARYRWLKERNGGSIGIVAWHRDEEQEMVLVDEHADAAIDAAIAQQKGEA